MRNKCSVFVLILNAFVLYAQEIEDTTVYTDYTFKTTRVISGHSVETLPKGVLDVRIAHRFGNIADGTGDNTFLGLDNAADVMIAGEYGLTDLFTVGLGRTKGAGELRELYNLSGKYRLYRQTEDGKQPVTVTLLANAAMSGMERNINNPDEISFLPNTSDRLTYLAQALIAKKVNSDLSLQLMPTYVHRNRVQEFDTEGLFSLGGSARYKFSNRLGIIVEYFHPFSDFRFNDDFRAANGVSEAYFDPFGIGLEIETGGHVFHINFTNSSAILENDFLPYSTQNWGDGEFRLGFTISRVFQVD